MVSERRWNTLNQELLLLPTLRSIMLELDQEDKVATGVINFIRTSSATEIAILPILQSQSLELLTNILKKR